MKTFLLPHLICPACLPVELPLEVTVKRIDGDDIVTGKLACRKCRQHFPIADGIACLTPDPDRFATGSQLRYTDSEMTNRYLWSHYADLAEDREVTAANTAWAGLLATTSDTALDTGCAVGRLTFEMAARSKWAVGCDLSVNFIRTARRLVQERNSSFSLPLEGTLREIFRMRLPDNWRCDNLEFVVADAQAIPFARSTFQQVSSLNLLDRVSYPLAHLYELNRVARREKATLLFADPFSWSTDSASEERWLGGKTTGEYTGRGIDNVRRLLTGHGKLLAPAWWINREGSVTWSMRTHVNHRERINSTYIVAER